MVATSDLIPLSLFLLLINLTFSCTFYYLVLNDLIGDNAFDQAIKKGANVLGSTLAWRDG